jgi:hypothetical protein
VAFIFFESGNLGSIQYQEIIHTKTSLNNVNLKSILENYGFSKNNAEAYLGKT